MFDKKTVTDNLALALALLCLGVIGGRAASSPGPRAQQTVTGSQTDNDSRVVLLLSEDFEQETAFAVDEGYAPVAYGTSNLGGSGAYWGRTVARAANSLFSSWCAGDGWNSPSLPLYGANCTPYYGGPCLAPQSTNTTMTTGPLNLSPYSAGTLTYELWLDTEAADLFSAEASIDGDNFYGYSYYGASNGFEPRQLQLDGWPVLGNLMDHTKVWFRFGYSSNDTVLMEGAYLDNIRIEVEMSGLIFNDGFESGNTSAWTAAQGELSYSQQVLLDNPIAYYRLDEASGETAWDASGNGNHGTYQNDVTLQAGGALSDGNSAALFDGLDDRVELPGNWGGAGWSELTIEAWVKISESTGNFQTIVAPSSGSGTVSHFQIFSAGNIVVYTNTGGCSLPVIPDSPPYDTWHHVAVVAASGSTAVYVDGSPLEPDCNEVFSYVLETTALAIGGNDLNRYLSGTIDEVAIYDSALPQHRLQAHIDAASAGKAGCRGGGSLRGAAAPPHVRSIRGDRPGLAMR